MSYGISKCGFGNPHWTIQKIKMCILVQTELLLVVETSELIQMVSFMPNRNDSTEYTDRCEVHNCADDFQTDFVTGIDDFQKCSTLFADSDKCEAYDDCEYKYLKHISVCESCNRIGWDQVFDGVQNAGHLSCLDVGSCHLEFNTLTEMDPVSYTHLDVYKRQM